MRTLLASVLGASFLLASSAAGAQDYGNLPQYLPEDPPQAPPRGPTRPTHWYGYETLATDGAALLLAVPALTSNTSAVQSVFGVGSVMTYGLGAPIVHFAHGHVGAGFADLGLRVGMPLVLGFFGGLIGATTYQPPPCSSSTLCGWGNMLGAAAAAGEGVIIGGLLGAGGAVALDAAMIAREPVKDHDAANGAEPSNPSTHIEPAFGVAPERRGGTRATLGVVGTF